MSGDMSGFECVEEYGWGFEMVSCSCGCDAALFSASSAQSARDRSGRQMISSPFPPIPLRTIVPGRIRHRLAKSTLHRRSDQRGGNSSAGLAKRPGCALVAMNGYGAAPHLVRNSENRLGLRCSLLLRGPDKEYTEATPGTTFHSGDHIRLSFLANEPGYFYVIQKARPGRGLPSIRRPRHRPSQQD